MLIHVDEIIGANILSVHLSGKIAVVKDLIIDPNDLTVVALAVDRFEKTDEIILPVNEIREFSKLGMVIDSEDDFAKVGDVIKIDRVLELGFQLKSLKVKTESGKKLGYVKDFLLSTDNFSIERLVVHRPVWQSLAEADFLIAKSQIVKITNSEITVLDAAEKNTEEEDFIPNFINPFREQRISAQNQIPDAKDIE